MLSLPIRWRLTLWYSAALGVILLLFCSLLLVLSYQQLLARLDAELHEELREALVENELAQNRAEFDDNFQARFHDHGTFHFIVWDNNQTVVFTSSEITSDVAKNLAKTPEGRDNVAVGTYRAMDGDYYRVASRTVKGPSGEYVVKTLTPLQPVISDIQTLLALVAVLLPASLLLAFVVGYFLAARALAPVERIARVADTITISQLNQRIEVDNPHDELGRLASTLNRLIVRLESAVDEIRRFTADASHELRTPLAILRSEAESALRKSRSSEEYQAALRIVVDEATRLGKLADQLLTLSRHDAGLGAARMDPVEIDPLLCDVVESLKRLADSRGITLAARCNSQCVVHGSDLRLSQAFFNVLENAIKYSSAGDLVEVEAVDQGEQVEVVIRDQGIGISPDHLSRIFERFYRVDPSRNSAIGGSGLGLAIAKSIVTAHQGTIQVRSEVGDGTEVLLRFPCLDRRSERKSEATRVHDLPHA